MDVISMVGLSVRSIDVGSDVIFIEISNAGSDGASVAFPICVGIKLLVSVGPVVDGILVDGVEVDSVVELSVFSIGAAVVAFKGDGFEGAMVALTVCVGVKVNAFVGALVDGRDVAGNDELGV